MEDIEMKVTVSQALADDLLVMIRVVQALNSIGWVFMETNGSEDTGSVTLIFKPAGRGLPAFP